jgi:O-antigen ligase
MQKHILKYKTILLFSILFSILFISIYNYNKTYATIEFEQKNTNVFGKLRYGEIYFASNGKYVYNEEYILPYDYSKYTTKIFKIKNPISTIHHIRLDPLRAEGEIYLRNFTFTQYDGFKKIHTHIDFSQTSTKYGHNIKILDQNITNIHLLATGSDPYINIGHTSFQINTDFTNYYEVLGTSILSTLIIMLFLLIYIIIREKYMSLQNIIIIFILTIYTLFTLLYSAGATPLAPLLVKIFFTIALIFVFINGVKKYYTSIKTIVLIMTIFIILIFLSEYANQRDTILPHINFYLKDLFSPILFSIFFPIVFMHQFQYKDIQIYKYLFTLLLFLMVAVIIIVHQSHIIYIDHIKTFGYRMYMGQWAEKNYTFFYLILMWGTISFFHLKKQSKYELFTIICILIISTFIIFNGYSVSAKLAFAISLLVYILFTIFTINIKLIHSIPLIISLYILFMPWISDIFIYFSSLHPRLASRESIIAISSALVKENFLFGYGFRTTPSIPVQEYLSSNLLCRYGNPTTIPAMNPHNVPLLIWLNFGLMGALAFSILIYKSLKKFIHLTLHQNNQPALLSLIISLVIISTFSWSGWWEIVYLTYSFFIAIIILSITIHRKIDFEQTS